MKGLICFFLIFTTSMVAQKDVFEVARNGSLEELKGLMKDNPDIINTKNENGHTPLILSSYNRNNDVALFLINNVKDINAKSSEGSPLMASVVKGNTEIVKALLDKGANP